MKIKIILVSNNKEVTSNSAFFMVKWPMKRKEKMNLPNLKEAKLRTKQPTEHIYLADQQNEPFLSGKKYFIKTYGCQMNMHDSEEIKALLESLGLTATEQLEEATVIVLNTCAVRENAQEKVIGFLSRCKHHKKLHPEVIIALCGCMAQEEVVVNELMAKHQYLDIIFGTHNINDLKAMIVNKYQTQEINVYSIPGKVYENISYQRDSRVKAWVNIMYGCDKFCTYCIVPYTRGQQRSRKSSEIIKEINKLLKAGYQEVTLLGQNVNAYGKDLPEEVSFAELLALVSQTKIPRIRFVTSHPWDFSDELIKVIAKYPNIMPYIHLPIQSGSNNILKQMGRKYTKEEYLNLFNKIKKQIPGVAITTDIIVGFPNETETDFNDTLEIVDTCQFDGAYTFIYSPREGTPAALIKDNITLEVKKARLQILNQKVNQAALKNNKLYLNQKVKVLIEDVSPKNQDYVFGYTPTMKLVNVKGNKTDIGQIKEVTITATKSFSLDGIIE